VSTPPTRFANAEFLMMGILANIGTPVVQSTSLSLTPPLVRVRRVPGEPSTMFDDHAHVEVMTFHALFQGAHDLAMLCQSTIIYAYATGVPSGINNRNVTIDATETILPPTEVPWPNPDVRVFMGTYRISTRALPA